LLESQHISIITYQMHLVPSLDVPPDVPNPCMGCLGRGGP
jgi:hypothetical protein